MPCLCNPRTITRCDECQQKYEDAIRADERAKVEAEVVAYLRERAEGHCREMEDAYWVLHKYADRVERGEHQAKGGGVPHWVHGAAVPVAIQHRPRRRAEEGRWVMSLCDSCWEQEGRTCDRCTTEEIAAIRADERADERAQIVAYLREQAERYCRETEDAYWVLHKYADALERGEYRPRGGG